MPYNSSNFSKRITLVNEANLLPLFLKQYVNIANTTIKQVFRFLIAYFSLDYVFKYFFMPYKKVDNIAGWFVGIMFKLIYLLFVVPLVLITILALIAFWYALPIVGIFMLVM